MSGPPGGDQRPTSLERWGPLLAGLAGTLLFLRPLLPSPSGSLLGRTFWYDGLLNIGDLGALHRNLSQGPGGRGLHDWLYDAPFFFPQPRALVTSELMPLAGLVTWPLGDAAVLSHNLCLLVACVLNVTGAAHLARALGVRPRMAIVAGLAFAFSAYTGFQSGRLQLLYLFPMPYALAAAWRYAHVGRAREAFTSAAWLACEALLCLYYTVFLAMALPVVLVAARLSQRRPGVGRDLVRYAAMHAALLAPVAWLLWPYAQLKESLGLTRSAGEVAGQSGDLAMFLWADRLTLMGRVIPDRAQWDTAYFPGLAVTLAAAAAVTLWVRDDLARRGPIVGALVLLLLAAPLVGVSALHLGLAVSVAWLAFRAREDGTSALAPTLLALAGFGLFLFGGTAPKAFGWPLGRSLYEWMHLHLPVVDGLRMVRRAGVLVDLAVIIAAAKWLDRHDRLFWGAATVVLLEGLPLGLGAQPVATSCTDAAYALARAQGAAAVADLSERPLSHPQMALRRHAAMLCGVATTEGLSGFTPALSRVVDDAARSLPDAASHAALWDLGLRSVVLRGGADGRWAKQQSLAMSGIVERQETAGPDLLLTLRPPTVLAVRPGERIEGGPVPVTALRCSTGAQVCSALIDGKDDGRWTTGYVTRGGESVTLQFDEAPIVGLEWHGEGLATDLPRGVAVERQEAGGSWVPWARFASLSPAGLGTNAAKPVYALPLPKARTKALRITQLGVSRRYWLSARELRVISEAP